MSEDDNTGAPAEADDTDDFKLETVPFDPRFPNQNQTKHCYSSFIDYHRCVKVRGEDYTPCQYYKKAFTSLCPISWVEKWETQMAEGRFPGQRLIDKYDKPKPTYESRKVCPPPEKKDDKTC